MRFRTIFEDSGEQDVVRQKPDEQDALAHQILSSHLDHARGNSGSSYNIYRGKKPAEDDSLHHDLVTSGWKHVDTREHDEGKYDCMYVRHHVKDLGNHDDGYISVETAPEEGNMTRYSVMHRFDGGYKYDS